MPIANLLTVLLAALPATIRFDSSLARSETRIQVAASLVQVRDQGERGKAYRFYVESAFAMPEMVGTHWFQWADQPATGRFDGESYGIGLVDVNDRPYAELVSALQASHRRVLRVHRGELPPVAERAATN